MKYWETIAEKPHRDGCFGFIDAQMPRMWSAASRMGTGSRYIDLAEELGWAFLELEIQRRQAFTASNPT